MLKTLAKASAGIKNFPGNQDAALVALQKWEFLFSQPQDMDKLIEILLMEADLGGGEVLVGRAEQLAAQLNPQSAKARALGNCMASRANFLLSATIEKYIADGKAGRVDLSKVTKSLSDVSEKYFNALQKLAEASGNDVVTNLERIRKSPLVEVSGRPERIFASNVELQRMRDFAIETNDLRKQAVQVIDRWLALTKLGQELTGDQTKPLSPDLRPMAKRLHDLQKPRAIIRDGLIPNEQELVETLERRLRL